MKERGRPGPKPRPGIREKLLDAGLGQLAADGYAATGVSEIAAAADVAKGSFYHYFDSKEAFAAAAAQHYADRHWALLEEILADPHRPPLDRLRHWFDTRIAAFRQAGYVRGCMLGNLGLEVSDHSALIRAAIDAHFARWSGLIAACIAEAQQQGALPAALPAEALGRHLLSNWEGAMLRMRVEKDDRALREFVDFTFGHLLAATPEERNPR